MHAACSSGRTPKRSSNTAVPPTDVASSGYKGPAGGRKDSNNKQSGPGQYALSSTAVSPAGSSVKQQSVDRVLPPPLPRLDPDEFELRKRLPSRFPTQPYDVYVTKRTHIKAQLARCHKLLETPGFGYDEIWIHGLGAAINRAVNLALQIKRELVGSVEIDPKTSTVELTDEIVPLLGDGDQMTRSRFTSAVHIRLFRPQVPVLDY